jgi:ABC-type glycerol-3-phosphate transport system permease component
MKIIDLQCWLVLFASSITAASAVLGLVAVRYEESLHENIALVCVALAGFLVTLQIWVHGIAQMTGITFLVCSMAGYALSRSWKKWRELYP